MVKVIGSESRKVCRFGGLYKGQTFWYAAFLFIKIDDVSKLSHSKLLDDSVNVYNALCLSSGELTKIDSHTDVEVVDVGVIFL